MNSKQNNEQVLAMSIVIIFNWLIAHLATSWALPPEVQSAVQSSLVIIIYWYARLTEQRELTKQLALARAAGWNPPITTPDPAPAAPESKAAA